ncbi:MAG: DUF3667 domain-containing protein [Planctomycetota bacterium]
MNADPNSSLSRGPETERFGEQAEAHWTETIAKGDCCANCGKPRSGGFCVDCGQKHLSGRLSFGQIIKQSFAQLTNLDRGLFHTFLDMCRKPGHVAKDYVSGKQRPYINPLTYFFLGAALQIVSLWFSQQILKERVIADFEPLKGSAAVESLKPSLGENVPEATAEIYISAMKQAYSYAALFFFAFPLAVFLMLFHKLGGEHFTLGETLVFALYAVAQMLIITAILTPIAVRIDMTVQMVVGPGAYIVITMLAHTGFFRRGFLARATTLISLVFAFLIFFASILAIFLASLLIHVALNAP